jgi:hypothetical protein
MCSAATTAGHSSSVLCAAALGRTKFCLFFTRSCGRFCLCRRRVSGSPGAFGIEKRAFGGGRGVELMLVLRVLKGPRCVLCKARACSRILARFCRAHAGSARSEKIAGFCRWRPVKKKCPFRRLCFFFFLLLVSARIGVSTNRCQHELASAQIGVSTTRCQHELVSARIGASTNWCQHELVSARIGVSTNWCQHESVSARVGVSTSWCQHELVSARIGVSTRVGVSTNWCQHKLVPAPLGASTTRCQHELVPSRIGVSTNWCQPIRQTQFDAAPRHCS